MATSYLYQEKPFHTRWNDIIVSPPGTIFLVARRMELVDGGQKLIAS